jgi:hypothetical protein
MAMNNSFFGCSLTEAQKLAREWIEEYGKE